MIKTKQWLLSWQNNVQRSRRELSIKHVWEKHRQNLCRNCFNLHDPNHHFYPNNNYYFKNLTNERTFTINRIVDKTFEQIGNWKFSSKKYRTSHAKFDYRVFFQSAFIYRHINALWNFFFRCVDLVPNLTQFEKNIQNAKFFKVCYNIPPCSKVLINGDVSIGIKLLQ